MVCLGRGDGDVDVVLLGDDVMCMGESRAVDVTGGGDERRPDV